MPYLGPDGLVSMDRNFFGSEGSWISMARYNAIRASDDAFNRRAKRRKYRPLHPSQYKPMDWQTGAGYVKGRR